MSEMGKPFLKNQMKTLEKEKIGVKMPHVIKKQIARKQIFVQTPFAHSTLKLERKKFKPQKHLLFRSIS